MEESIRLKMLGRIPWNKGKSIFNGIKNPFYGKKHTQESIEKNRIAHLGKKLNKKQLDALSYGRKLKKGKPAPWARNNPQTFKKGQLHINWKGGCKSWRGKDWKKLAKIILKRDNFGCQKCNSNKNLSVHHIIPWRINNNNSTTNLISLCKRCHFIADLKYSNREKLLNYTNSKLGNGA